jgi:hypothetical protein
VCSSDLDTVELARESADVFEQMARVALSAALYAQTAPNLRVTPPPTRRAVFVASHTEPVQMGPASFAELGMAFAIQGLNVDMVPYGRAVMAADLKDAAVVVALPVVDYPTAASNLNLYDEAWTPGEIAVLEQYVADGGFLVITNSARRFISATHMLDANEDWSDVNALSERFGVTFAGEPLAERYAYTQVHALTTNVPLLWMNSGASVPFTMTNGQILAQSTSGPVMALKPVGARGQVLVIGDLAILGATASDLNNLRFWRNLAGYALGR